MSNTNTGFHHVTRVTAGELIQKGNTKWRSLFIYTEGGNKYEIELFTDKLNNLIIKEEKE